MAWDEREKKTFRSLCQIMCTEDEVCAVMDLTPADLEREVDAAFGVTVPHDGNRLSFHDAFAAFSAGGRVSIRRKQYELAMDGDRAMLTWLGKQYLGQSDQRVPAKQEQQQKPRSEGQRKRGELLELARSDRMKRAGTAG